MINKKGFALPIVILIIGLLVIGGGLGYVYLTNNSNYSTEYQQNEKLPTTQEQKTISPSPSSDITPPPITKPTNPSVEKENSSPVSCSDVICFNKAFASCRGAVFTDTAALNSTSSFRYTIIGNTTGGCSVNQKVLIYPVKNWEGLQMECVMDNSKTFSLAQSDIWNQINRSPGTSPCKGSFIQAILNEGGGQGAGNG